MTYLLIMFCAALIAAGVVPLARKISLRYQIFSVPGGRRKHNEKMPQLGGLPIAVGYLVGVGLIWFLMAPDSADDALRLRGVLVGTIIVFAGGLLDDKFELPYWGQFIIQFLGTAIAIWSTVFLEIFTNPFTGDVIMLARPLVWLVTAFWIVGIMNAVNWLDGLDGLATGVGMIACVFFGLHARSLGQEAVAAYPFVLAGACAGFLFFNFAPARMFLGSAGVYVLGYNLATLAILSPAKTATLLLVLALPLVDSVWRIIDRIRDGRSPFHGDRGHLHFLLLDQGWPMRRIVLVYYAVAILLGIVALFAPSTIKFAILTIAGVSLTGFIIWFRWWSENSS